jgi:hypothetical protein
METAASSLGVVLWTPLSDETASLIKPTMNLSIEFLINLDIERTS